MTPFDDFAYLINHVLLGDEPTIEDFILLVGTLVAFIAFILWCCFPIQPKDATNHRQFSCKSIQNSLESAQVHSSYSKSGPLTHNEYTMKNGGHAYHCCT
ncbi:uncharacterized protein LOC129239231 [Anastrepha obliqua]|uniref:uncharacterized protein LOC128858950 n=1 Tax=Anastrepha ludens TaxID=28586 RepID=UPI0023B0FA30|nr:uncharacterized protein LOC128858950 [Anastrepha ludens]XP_053951539.1 uncharacterized protein LOC128858950 [Anastrepha ludens]XP_053951540.1 uncharacterized protein LOC128858950 [Anastrepha ludens]XP_054730558.1 uncharacterized protein LOC129239231 [Anastrepha obliqua]